MNGSPASAARSTDGAAARDGAPAGDDERLRQHDPELDVVVVVEGSLEARVERAVPEARDLRDAREL
jgi:hypothetical protein